MSQLQHWDKLARRYHCQVISPFAPKISFRLPNDISSIVRSWGRDGSLGKRVAIDFGCGVGDGLQLLAGRFPLAAGIDFCEAMLQQSYRRLHRERHPVQYLRGNGLTALADAITDVKKRKDTQRHTFLVKANMERLRPLANSVDIGLAINSFIAPTPTKNRRMFREVARSLTKGGTLFLVMPSLDTVEYLFKLFHRYDIDASSMGSVQQPEGIFVEPSGLRQKYYTPDEIVDLLEENNLHMATMEKVLYPWSLIKRFGWGYFPRHRRLWDWYVIARRTR